MLNPHWHIARMLLVLIFLGVAAFPIYWMLVTSLTPSSELFADTPNYLPSLTQLYVYLDIFSLKPLNIWLLNSTIVAVGATVVSIALAIFPAYALSRLRFIGRGSLGFGLFTTQMLPEAMLVVPLYAIFGKLALLNSLAGLIMVNAAFTAPIVIWILKGAIDAIPLEIEEAARVDGCSKFGIIMTIVVPLIAPTLAAAAVIAFFHGWNEYVFAQTFITQESKHTASVGLASFIGELSTPLDAVMAVAIIYTFPAIIFYLLVQKHVVAGMTAGSVKG